MKFTTKLHAEGRRNRKPRVRRKSRRIVVHQILQRQRSTNMCVRRGESIAIVGRAIPCFGTLQFEVEGAKAECAEGERNVSHQIVGAIAIVVKDVNHKDVVKGTNVSHA